MAGDVRELRHLVERLVATTVDEEITADAVRAMTSLISFATDAQVPLLLYENDSLEAFLNHSIISLYDQLLAKTGSHSQAARLLGIDRTGLYQRLERSAAIVLLAVIGGVLTFFAKSIDYAITSRFLSPTVSQP